MLDTRVWEEAVIGIVGEYSLVLPRGDGLENTSKGSLAHLVIGDKFAYDHALPQPLVDYYAQCGVDIRGEFVYAYPAKYSTFGILFPLTGRAFQQLVESGNAREAE